ncbi:epimerase [Polynucleobacter tropicus]|uniref:Epimerase n=1 Tax=Polynucleobacter tropicus TaxID=1743174 RepID=A0A6M9PZ63_9BURK|nr:NAD(P)-dependent oxidoreductase [Polynucleobacter tropicus]QKM64045.1 epimerase [Polynucleobacter tropicus]
MKKKILLTGGSGFIGRNTIDILLSCGYEIHAVTSSGSIISGNINWHSANLLDSAQVKKLCMELKPSHLLHLAWYAEPGRYQDSPENFKWLEATVSLLRHFVDFGGRRIVMAGTCAEYNWDNKICDEYSTLKMPQSPYAVCKNAMQEILHSYSKNENISSAWGRIFFLYGPNEDQKRLVPSAINSLLGRTPFICKHGGQICDFLHVEDVASALVHLLDCEVKGAVNICSGQAIALHELLLKIAKFSNSNPRLIKFDSPLQEGGMQPFVVGSNKRLTEEVGWSPKYDLDQGLMQTIAARRLIF